MTINLSELSDTELEDYRAAVETECRRRDDLRRIPQDMRMLAETYIDGGGDRTDLIQVLTDTPVPE